MTLKVLQVTKSGTTGRRRKVLTQSFKQFDVISMVDESKEYGKLLSILLFTIDSFLRSCSLKFFSENYARKTNKCKLCCQHVFFMMCSRGHSSRPISARENPSDFVNQTTLIGLRRKE